MARQPGIKVLMSTPTDPSEAGPENRLCVKCGLWDKAEGDDTKGDVLRNRAVPTGSSPGLAGVREGSSTPFNSGTPSATKLLLIGKKGPKDEELVKKLCNRAGIAWGGVEYIKPVFCGNDDPSPNNIHCCRAFILGAISQYHAGVVLALGDAGLAALTGNCSDKVTQHLGRVIDIPELPEVIAYATYHPEEQREMKKAMQAIQKGMRLSLDIKKTQWEELKKPVDIGELISKEGTIGFDSEFDDEKVWTLGFGDKTMYTTQDIEEHGLGGTLMPNFKALVAHYAQVDLDSLVRLGIAEERWLKGEDIYDTFVLANLQNENLVRKGNYGIEDVLCRLYRAPDWKHETEVLDPSKPGSWGYDKRVKRCGYDAWGAYKIYEHPSIQRIISGSSFVVKWLHRMIPTYHRMKYTGVAVNRTKFDMLHDQSAATEAQVGPPLEHYIKTEYNWSEFSLTNNNHLSSLLYDEDKMNFPVMKRTKTGQPSTDADALDDFAGTSELIADLLVWRSANKLMSTWYGKSKKTNSKSIPLYERIYWDSDGGGYLPVNLGVGQTTTGRRQSNAPNMQNWAKPTRQIVTSRFGDKGTLIWADFEKLEVFLLADELKSEKMLGYFMNRGGYLGIAEDLMGSKNTKDHPNYRATKATALAANYYAKPFTIANQLYYKAGVRFSDDYGSVPFKEKFKTEHYLRSERILQTYYHMFPELPDYFERVRQELLRTQQVVNRLGQVRHLPCPMGERTPGFNHLLNQAINYKIQSVAGMVTGIAAVLMEAEIVRGYWDSYQSFHEHLYTQHKFLVAGNYDRSEWKRSPYLCNEVHDELAIDCPRGVVGATKEMMERIMTQATKEVLKQGDPTFDAHLAVEMEQGQFWHVKEEV